MTTDKLVDFDHVTDYISREAAWNGIYNCPTKTDADGYIWVRTKDVAHMIDEIPAADVRPVVHGAWKPNPRNPYWLDCTVCGYGKPERMVYNFCPNCGADCREPNLDATKGDNHD